MSDHRESEWSKALKVLAESQRQEQEKPKVLEFKGVKMVFDADNPGRATIWPKRRGTSVGS